MLYDAKKWDKKMPVAQPWRQTLLDAAKLLEEKGWCRGYLMDDRGRRCVVGAIHAVRPMMEGRAHEAAIARGDAIERLGRYLARDMAKVAAVCIPDWNDHTVKSGKQVIETMRACAKHGA